MNDSELLAQAIARLDERVAQHEQEGRELRATLAELRTRMSPVEAAAPSNSAETGDAAEQPRANRRNFVKLLGASAVGTAMAVGLGSEKAAAADGNPVLLGSASNASNTASTTTTLTNSAVSPPVGAAAFKGFGPPSVSGNSTNGLVGEANGSAAAGVFGTTDSGYGLYGAASTGYGVYVGGNGRLGLASHVSSGLPTSGSFAVGDIFRNAAGDAYICVTAGTAGSTAVFRKLAGPSSAGQFHLLSTPLRAYDSRPSVANAAATGGDGLLTCGVSGFAERTVSVANGRTGPNSTIVTALPAGASAALFNVTLSNTAIYGYLSIFSDAIAWPGTSNTNFYANGQIIAATSVSAVSSSLNLKVRIGGTTGSACDFLIDVIGYYA